MLQLEKEPLYHMFHFSEMNLQIFFLFYAKNSRFHTVPNQSTFSHPINSSPFTKHFLPYWIKQFDAKSNEIPFFNSQIALMHKNVWIL